MKTSLIISIVILGMLAFCLPDLAAQDTIRKRQDVEQQEKDKSGRQQQKFVDEDGDGYNDNAPDHDGDGIPNRLDPDWKKLQKKKKSIPFEDLDGDGVNDNLQQGEGEGEGKQQQMQQNGQEEDGSSVKGQEQSRGQKGKKKGKN